jgi:3-deoxy-D-manno-octulosonate 8-phosphate phosphatase (KDO 8-P phosphatase)
MDGMVETALASLNWLRRSSFGPGLSLVERARRIRLLLTDCDGVLTDGTVYYSERGEALKRFNMRDGMGVERLRGLAQVDVGIISGETSPSVQQRAAKLGIDELHLGVRDKPAVVAEITARRSLTPEQVAYIGDDVNDLAAMGLVGLAACPADATHFAKAAAHLICQAPGGAGVLREVAELIIAARLAPAANGGVHADMTASQERDHIHRDWTLLDERSEW